MIDRQNHTRWVPEPIDEKTPVSVYPSDSRIRLKDTDPPPPVITKSIHEPMRPHKTCTSPTVLQPAPTIVIQPSLLETISDASQADTLLVARRIYARKIGYLLVAVASAVLTGALVVLLVSLV